MAVVWGEDFHRLRKRVAHLEGRVSCLLLLNPYEADLFLSAGTDGWMEGYVIAIGKPQKAFVFLEDCITAFLVCNGLSPCCSFDRWQVMAAGNKGPLFVLRNTA